MMVVWWWDLLNTDVSNYLKITNWSLSYSWADHWCDIPQHLDLLSVEKWTTFRISASVEFVVLVENIYFFLFYPVAAWKASKLIKYLFLCQSGMCVTFQFNTKVYRKLTICQTLYWMPGTRWVWHSPSHRIVKCLP